jgi:uncharacterized membrane protein
MNWDLADYIAAAALIGTAVLAIRFLTLKSSSGLYRAGAGVAVFTGLLLVWVNLAVGIIGSEGNPANLMYGGVLLIGPAGALMGRFRAKGMARTLFAMAVAQVAAGVIAIVGDMGTDGEGWPRDIFIMTGFFSCLWLFAAVLFGRAARKQ